MRVWHLSFVVLVAAVGMTVARELPGQVFLVMFLTGIAEVACATAALMTLFKTVGSFGKAESLMAHAEAVAATALVLILATAVMTGLLWLMGSVLQTVVA
jgi:hypothetical protein